MFVEPHEHLENAKQTGMVLGALNNKEWKVDLKRKAERDETETAVGEPEMKQECNVDFKIGNGRSSGMEIEWTMMENGMEWGMEINMFNGMWNKKIYI